MAKSGAKNRAMGDMGSIRLIRPVISVANCCSLPIGELPHVLLAVNGYQRLHKFWVDIVVDPANRSVCKGYISSVRVIADGRPTLSSSLILKPISSTFKSLGLHPVNTHVVDLPPPRAVFDEPLAKSPSFAGCEPLNAVCGPTNTNLLLSYLPAPQSEGHR